MKRLIVDTSSLIWTSLFRGDDKEFGRKVNHEGRMVQVNSASHGYENAIDTLVMAMNEYGVVPSRVILVIEGQNGKAMRRALLPGYKDGDARAPEQYEEFNKCRTDIIEMMKKVGALACTQNGIEGDDIVAYLCENLDGEKVILSNDGDLSILISDTVSQYRMGVHNPNPIEPLDRKYLTLYKSLKGDASDNIPGAKGFGGTAWLNMAVAFDDAGFKAFMEIMQQEETDYFKNGRLSLTHLATLKEDVSYFKPLQKVLDNAETVARSWLAAKLYPNKCNTLRNPLQWQVGMVKGEVDERLKKWAGTVTLVTAGNYEKVKAALAARFASSPFVALDIETSTPDESDEWLQRMSGDDDTSKVDVLGSRLTGMGLTFGDNGQHTIYVSVDHADTQNVTSEMCRQLVELVPSAHNIVVHNASFELSVLYQEWGAAWVDNGYHGFLPNILDTKIEASYVDENLGLGLKKQSLERLGYTQESYDEVTTVNGVKHKMNQLSARHVLSYGADDTICTSALHNFFMVVMEIEKSWETYKAIEIGTAYLDALRYVQGTKISMERMRELIKEDQAAYDEAWKVLRAYLIEKGYDGTVCPQYEELTPANVKEAWTILTGLELKTGVRLLAKLAAVIREQDHEHAPLFAKFVESNGVVQVNDWVKSVFKGEPVLDQNSPKKMKRLFYEVMGLRVQLVNSCTPTERSEKPQLAKAIGKHKKIWAEESTDKLSAEELVLIQAKAKTDDKALGFALFDLTDAPEDQYLKRALEAFITMKKVDTRFKMFYRPYEHVQHWKDRKVHAQVNQCQAVTRRPSSSSPNLFQLPKKGEGVKFREVYVPHHRDAVVVSIDFGGQELRLAAGCSMDSNMLACYIGDNLKDMHSLTAAGAMQKKWGVAKVSEYEAKYGLSNEYDLFVTIRKSKVESDHKAADDLRKVAKNVNFASQYDALAPKIAETIIVPVADAKAFLDSKDAMFPRFNDWKLEVKASLRNQGFVSTLMGARRHLRDGVLAEGRMDREKAERQGPNFIIQGSAAEQTKYAQTRVWESGVLWKCDMVFIANIYDELVWSVHRDDCIESIRIIHGIMTMEYATLCTPVVGSISLGKDFGKQIECGDDFDPVAIQKALDRVFEPAPVVCAVD